MARVNSTEDVNPTQPADIILKDGTLATSGNAIVTIDRPLNAELMEEIAFMEEEITIMVQETADENAENPVIVGNNGVFKQFFRGVPTLTKRKFVDSLIVKTGRVSTPEYINNAGERARKISQHSAHKYPFMVVKDSNPKGAEWLTQRLSEQI